MKIKTRIQMKKLHFDFEFLLTFSFPNFVVLFSI